MLHAGLERDPAWGAIVLSLIKQWINAVEVEGWLCCCRRCVFSLNPLVENGVSELFCEGTQKTEHDGDFFPSELREAAIPTQASRWRCYSLLCSPSDALQVPQFGLLLVFEMWDNNVAALYY